MILDLVVAGRATQASSTMTPADVGGRILLAIAVVILASRILAWGASRIGQPQVVGEIVAGIVLGPSVLGLVWAGGVAYMFPPEVIDALKVVAQLGLVLFMFLVGAEIDLSKLRGQGHKAVVISHVSIILPMCLGALLSIWLYPRFGAGVDHLGFSLFLGAAMAITAFPVLARILQESGLYDTRIGVLTLTCAAIDDVTAWCVLAGVVAIVESTGPADALVILALSLAFVVVMLAIVRPLLSQLPGVPVWAALALALLAAWTTEEIGIHAIFGAFVAGAAMPRNRAMRHNVHDKVETVTLSLLLPVFFVVVGLDTRIDLLNSTYLWLVTAAVIAVAVLGKWGGSTAAARVTGESWRDAAAIGVLMNTRGLTELVILGVGLELGVISTTMFTVMVLMAIVTTLMATPVLALISRRRLRTPVVDPLGGDVRLRESRGLTSAHPEPSPRP